MLDLQPGRKSLYRWPRFLSSQRSLKKSDTSTSITVDLIVNVFLYCFMDLKPARPVSQIWARKGLSFNRFFMKLFRTNDVETVKVCQFFFGISLPSVVLRSRTDKFEPKFSLCADLVKALVWAAVILPCCLCSFVFLSKCYHYVWWIKLNIYIDMMQGIINVKSQKWKSG